MAMPTKKTVSTVSWTNTIKQKSYLTFKGSNFSDMMISSSNIGMSDANIINGNRYRNESPQSSKKDLRIHFEDNTEECAPFLDVVSFAEYFVDNIITEVNKMFPFFKTSTSMSSNQEFFGDRSDIDYYYGNLLENDEEQAFTKWPRIGDFSIELGGYKINQFLSSFRTNEEWMYAIYYVRNYSEPGADFYKYVAIYSLPTVKYPIVQATASIYFIIEVSKLIPQCCPVRVTYFYETNGFRQDPCKSKIDEITLNYILDSRIALFKTLRY